MAVAMSTFGSTLSDLQRLTNEDRALDYHRANAQDAVNAQRLSDFLKARSEQGRTQAQRDATLAQIVEAQQARMQRGTQFDTEQRNLMELEKARIQADRDIAEITTRNRGFDPRTLQTITQIQAVNNERQNEIANFKKLSDQRQALVAERAKIKANRKKILPNFRDPKAAWYDFADFGQPDDPRWTQLNTLIAGLDAEASKFGLPVGPDEGYVIPEFTPIPLPAILNPTQPPSPAPSPAPPPPTAPPPEAAVEIDPGGVFARIQALNQGLNVPNAITPRAIPGVPQPTPRWRLLPDGRTVAIP